jgi:hypothetical protein
MIKQLKIPIITMTPLVRKIVFCMTFLGLAIAIFEMFCIPVECQRKTSWMFYSTMLLWMTYFIATTHVGRTKKRAFIIKAIFFSKSNVHFSVT